MPADNAQELNALIQSVEGSETPNTDEGDAAGGDSTAVGDPEGPPVEPAASPAASASREHVKGPAPVPIDPRVLAARNARPAPPRPSPQRAVTQRTGAAVTTAVVGAGARHGQPMSPATMNAMARARQNLGENLAPPTAPGRPQAPEPPPAREYSEAEHRLRAALGVDLLEAELAAMKATNKDLQRIILKGRF
jgi:hypothetical protein